MLGILGPLLGFAVLITDAACLAGGVESGWEPIGLEELMASDELEDTVGGGGVIGAALQVAGAVDANRKDVGLD